jgi:hypothetical protein
MPAEIRAAERYSASETWVVIGPQISLAVYCHVEKKTRRHNTRLGMPRRICEMILLITMQQQMRGYLND